MNYPEASGGSSLCENKTFILGGDLVQVPTTEQAALLLEDAYKMNPGPWADHSKVVGSTAKAIAASCPDLDEDIAYTLGLLHDIGRREGWKHIAHIMDGYKYLTQLGYTDAASICLTHSFPIKDVHTYLGRIDCSQEDLEFIDKFLAEINYSDYDRLIQLCDAISLPHGAVLMEKRLVDVAIRHGLPEWTLRKWKSFFELKQYFDLVSGKNIYTLIPDIVDNTFEW